MLFRSLDEWEWDFIADCMGTLGFDPGYCYDENYEDVGVLSYEAVCCPKSVFLEHGIGGDPGPAPGPEPPSPPRDVEFCWIHDSAVAIADCPAQEISN